MEQTSIVEVASYLGTHPICDVCRKRIQDGERVTQIFTGATFTEYEHDRLGEMGILEEKNGYNLYHNDCIQPLVVNYK